MPPTLKLEAYVVCLRILHSFQRQQILYPLNGLKYMWRAFNEVGNAILSIMNLRLENLVAHSVD